MPFTFTLNGQAVTIEQAAPATTLLDWLRVNGHTGSKQAVLAANRVVSDGAPGTTALKPLATTGNSTGERITNPRSRGGRAR